MKRKLLTVIAGLFLAASLFTFTSWQKVVASPENVDITEGGPGADLKPYIEFKADRKTFQNESEQDHLYFEQHASPYEYSEPGLVWEYAYGNVVLYFTSDYSGSLKEGSYNVAGEFNDDQAGLYHLRPAILI